jgi:ABC-type transport system substrate-binding protein
MHKLVVASMVLLFVALGWGRESVGGQPLTPQGELRIVDKGPFNWASVALNIFEHLIALDKDGRLVPRLATGWQWLDDHTLEITLRRGVRFHNGEVFDAEIVQLNWEENTRLKQPFAVGTFLSFKPGTTLEIIDPYTVRFRFPEPDGGALVKLSITHMANRQFYRDFGWDEKHW